MLDIVTTVIILVAVGLGAGTLGSMIGVGGGIMMVPALAFLGLPPTQIASTSLFAVTSTSVSSTIAYSRQKRIDYRLGVEMAAFAVPGAVVGALLSGQLSAQDFRLYFGILLSLVGLYVAFRSSILKEKGEKRSPARRVAVYAITFGAGIISSLFGVGGGIIFVPAMLLVLGMAVQKAAPTSQLTLMITALVGVFTHSALGHPDYVYALALSAGAFVGAQLGARWSRKAKEVLLQRMLGAVLIAVAGKFIFDWFSGR
ncbi:MAG: sulfite exporter TauE/SafE family protein [Nitrososphaera sp.]|nr:sulfite exporter TauE/SafE family protein [Nitrososphaera sp.]